MTSARSSLLFALLVLVSFGIKLAVGHDGEADEARLTRDVARRLAAQRFVMAAPADAMWLTAAVRGECRILVGSGDGGGADIDDFRMAAAPARVVTGYRGVWSARTIGPRAAFERQVQERAFALGMVVSRPAVLNVALSGPGACPRPADVLDELSVWPRPRSLKAPAEAP